MRRLAHHQSAAFTQFGPKMFEDYRIKLSALLKKFPALMWNFSGSIFPAASWNFGPNAVTYSHADHCNRAIGWCAITALGQYDPTRGGHLVLESFRLIIEFPPGATILIPSASCIHSNTPIQCGESRMAFTQYAAGGLFRFVDYGFRSWKKLQVEDPALSRQFEVERGSRWAKELKLYSKTSELHQDRQACDISK
ncbi:hypothetical protein NM688_g6086 [Phlebia brevispora]|uniref:Uncharacterized protein n=1 Tax=Phlebia brevispora TaxID=194682 RepID=A0ACC1SKC2_9APHY|nr:hypothetical protein NM688_g6086 [Phlebia brevispora]